MPDSRRTFLQQLAASSLALAPLAGSVGASIAHAAEPTRSPSPDVDTSWRARLTGRHKAVYDCESIASGLGPFRAGVVKRQYLEAFGLTAADVSNVVVLRHDGIWLAMNQACWDAYRIGEVKGVLHPFTEQPTAKNPALLGAADGMPPGLADFALDRQIAAGTVVLSCALAFNDVVAFIAKADGTDEATARRRAASMLIPGIIMQPSGVFATTVAQEAGCVYVRAT